MIRISCERDWLWGWEKMAYARALGRILGQVRVMQAMLKDEGFEGDWWIVLT